MQISSEYTFPIFISSTDYNLKDLRAELARFLSELGYRPILSSAEGFPDSSPVLEPWESCIPVLDQCFVMVLIIDGQYGTALDWPNYNEIFEGHKISPTHGEYFFAHKTRKRMLVFIRKSLMPHYQSYRTTIKKCGYNKKKAKDALKLTLPDYVSFETLDFINIVKTTKPIPWIVEFDDITCVKKEIQKKMLNELAELFLIKNKHFDIVIDSFNKLMDSLTYEEQKKALSKITATKEIIDAVDKLEEYKKEAEELEETKSIDIDNYEMKIDLLTKKINKLEKDTQLSSNSQFFIKGGQVRLGNPNYIDNFTNLGTGTLGNSLTFDSASIGVNQNTFQIGRKCDGCGKIQSNNILGDSAVFIRQLNTCPSCKKDLCHECWPKYNGFSNLGTGKINLGLSSADKCPECKQ